MNNFSPLTLTAITDVHYYSKKTGTSGAAYDKANAKSQKLLADSPEVIAAAFNQIAKDKRSDIVIISGDVTNEGETNAHHEFIEHLRALKNCGKRVYVLTATHDYKSDGARGYFGDETGTVPALRREDLFDLYREFGPDEALSVDRESMSYIIQLADGYRLFALNDDSNHNGKSGFSEETFAWIVEQAKKAKEDNQFIIAMTHHPLIAPSPIYEIIGKGDMMGDYDKRINQLADLGIQFIFTGHTHIHDISAHVSENGNVIYDICTGSLIGYPGTIRSVTFAPAYNEVRVSTDSITEPVRLDLKGKTLQAVFENQLVGVIRDMIDTAGKDIDRLADMATAISIKPKLIYKIGWIIKPIFKLLNSIKIGTVAAWSKKESGLRPSDYAAIKDRKVVDFIIELVICLFGGERKYPPASPEYKITTGFLSIIDSILNVIHVDLFKITKVAHSAVGLVEPLLYKPDFDSYNDTLKIYPANLTDKPDFVNKKSEVTVKSKKGLPILIIGALALIPVLPIILLLLLFGFVKNQIQYGKKLK